MDLVEHDPERLAGLTHAELAELGGFESAEVIMWLVMRGALSAQVHCSHRAYTLPSMTGIATMLFENRSSPPVAGEVARQRQAATQQLQGLEKLPGTYPFTLQRSVANYKLNRFLHSLVQPQARAAFLADEAAACRQAGLSEPECTMVLQRDWQGLIRHGAIFFVLEKLGAVVGISNLHIYAAMRGEGLQDFLLTRNAPGALYSVAAQPASQPAPSGTACATGGNAPSDPLHFP